MGGAVALLRAAIDRLNALKIVVRNQARQIAALEQQVRDLRAR